MQPLLDWFFRLYNLWRKELLVLLKDPGNRIILIMPVLVQTFLFGYAATFDLNDVPYALLDQSHGQASMDLIAKLDGTGIFHRVETLYTPGQIEQVIDSSEALLVIHFASDFEERLHSGVEAPMQLILDGRNSNTAGSAASYIATIVADFNAQRQGNSVLGIEARSWYNPNLQTQWPLVPGLIASLSMLQTLLLTALSVAREREQGTFDQLLVTPYSPTEILLGKAVPPVLIGMSQAFMVLAMAIYWFDIPMAGSIIDLSLGLLLFTIASVGLGMSISAVSLTMQQAMLYTFVLIMPLMLLSGLATPVRNMPEILQIATYANPLRFGIDLVQRIYLEGVGLGDLIHDLIPLLVVGVITLPLAGWLFRHRLS